MLIDDDSFIQHFEALTLPPTAFKHRGHLRIAWLYLTRYPFPQAAVCICDGIARYATSLGAAHIYDTKLTQQWIIRITLTLLQGSTATSFDEWLAAHPELLIK